MSTQTPRQESIVEAVPAAAPEEAREHFARRLRLETDPADVAADLRAGTQRYTVVDVRSARAYDRGRLPGAVSLPAGEITAQRAAELPAGLLVVYCWGPGCNGAHRAGAALAAHGRRVKEMLGGFEYWVREGLPTEGSSAPELERLAQHALVG